jgi:RimJ/RimL family protein N-acetyltransferase
MVMRELWEYLCDDSVIAADQWQPRMNDESRWYVAYLEDDIMGVFWMERRNAVTWEAHANVRPKYWGNKRGTECCKLAIEEMIKDTDAKKVIALIPDCSPNVQRMAEEIGFEREGIQRQSWQKNGKLYDQKHYGITRQ